MSYISPVATDANGAARQTGSLQTLGRDDFLQLLVTKLEYQDPLNPMEDEDFIAQLAQFSSLEQMKNIADGIASSNEWDYLQMQSINNTMAAGLIGKDVKASYGGVVVDGETDPTVTFTNSVYASEVTLTIKDSTGNVVRRLTMDNVQAGLNSLTWDGRDSLGNSVEEGYYVVEAAALDGAGALFTPSLSLVGTVESITYRDGAAYLKVRGVEISLGDVTAVGEPGAFDS
jgi:flagellar basal-body rod modification protein FlgD